MYISPVKVKMLRKMIQRKRSRRKIKFDMDRHKAVNLWHEIKTYLLERERERERDRDLCSDLALERDSDLWLRFSSLSLSYSLRLHKNNLIKQ